MGFKFSSNDFHSFRTYNEPHKLIPTDLDEILTIHRTSLENKCSERTGYCNLITFELFALKVCPWWGHFIVKYALTLQFSSDYDMNFKENDFQSVMTPLDH